jgi:hypothetical protein
MVERKLIIRLDGGAPDSGASCLLVYWLEGMAEVVVTEERAADARVVLSREQLQALAEALVKAAHASARHDAS